jgi:hypothetical protein
MREGLRREWANGIEAHHREGEEGAAGFAHGLDRGLPLRWAPNGSGLNGAG